MSFARFASTLFLGVASFAAETVPGSTGGLTVHEWGTFTSVADRDGSSIPWTVLADDGDLPCFVIRPQFLTKVGARSWVRMETPVLYFYTPRPATVSVGVDFPKGRITEYYPPAERDTVAKRLDWAKVEVVPGEDAKFPGAAGRSHYFAARATDASPLRVGDSPEKFLFYRGIGDFEVPVHPRFTADGDVEIDQPFPAILFENRGGKIGYRLATGKRIAAPELTGTVDDLREKLTGLLVEAGLYPKEARAMFETWRDSWFEEGMRLLYLVPRDRVDEILPLHVTPKPEAIERVFVGRVELLSPAMRDTIGTALAQRDEKTLLRYGRFLTALTGQLTLPDSRMGQFLQSVEAAAQARAIAECVR
jgi:hypothetical protein